MKPSGPCLDRSITLGKLAVALLAAGPLAHAQSHRLSDPFPMAPLSADVMGVQNSPDGLSFVYETSAGALYSVQIGAAGVVHLNPRMTSSTFVISEDGTRVVFLGIQDGVVSDLYSIPIDGSAAPKPLHASAEVAPGSLREIVATEDGDLLFTAPIGSIGVDFRYGLFSTAVVGAPVLRLSPPTLGGGVVDFERIPGARAVVFSSNAILYRADLPGGSLLPLGPGAGDLQVTPDGSCFLYQINSGTPGLFAQSTAGGSIVTLVAGTVPDEYLLSPPGDLVVYRVGIQIFSVPIGGGSATTLDATLSGVDGEFSISLDGSCVIHRNGALFSVPTNGGNATPLSSVGAYVYDFQLARDGQRVVYRAQESGAPALYSVPLQGGSPLRLDQAAVGATSAYSLAPDSTRVSYLQSQVGGQQLYSVSITGGTPISLGPTLSGGRSVSHFFVSNDSLGVAFLADIRQEGIDELYGVPMNGLAQPVRLSGPLPRYPTADVSSFEVTPDSSRVVYLANAERTDMTEVYSKRCNGSGSALKLNAPIPDDATVVRCLLSPDGTRAVFQVDSGLTWSQLFSAPVDGSSAAVRIDENQTPTLITSFALSGQRALYRVRSSLFSAPLDGSANPNRLGTFVSDYQALPGGQQALFRRSQQYNDIFVVPSDDSSPPLRLTDNQAMGLSIPDRGLRSPSWGVTSDETRLVFLASASGSSYPLRLYSVPLDGSSSPIEISGPLSGFEYVQGFFLNERVVYIADQDTLNRVELYSVPADGSSLPVKLNGAFPAGGQVMPWLSFDAASHRVIYQADAFVDEQYQFFSVPIDGSAPAVALPGTDGNAGGLALTDEGHVVFTRSNAFWSAPIDGSGSALQISGTVTADGGFKPLGNAGQEVVFEADSFGGTTQMNLYVAPLDASAPPRPIDRYLGPGGSLKRGSRLLPDKRQVLYISDEDRPYVNELFAAPLDPTHVRLKR